MKRFLLMAAILLQCVAVAAQQSGNDLKISILTCAHGKEIYASFGHCAFRAYSSSRKIDKVYNYGTFNYHQPLFVIKFVRGFLDYAVSCYDYDLFRMEYILEKRLVHEQVLNLTPEQAQSVYDFLEWNALEKNRYYKYNFLEDNCATRIRDVLKNACGDNLVYPDTTYAFTLRDAIDERIEEMPWFRFGVTLLMGLPVDKKATAMTAMFLPDYVYNTINDTKILRDGKPVSIVSNDHIVIYAKEPVSRTTITTYISPALLLWILFAVWAWFTYKEIKNSTYHSGGDKALLFILGMFGILFFVMWFFTEHTVTAWNMNLLWALPTHVVAAWAVKSQKKFWKTYYKVTAITTGAMLILAPVIPQHYDPAFYPILLMTTMRLARIGWRDNA
ncbi:MAG: DUF4105 domain-containing protein [Bacteroidales bacterium]|nr:DUF4105 domain-containing protein [Bacteroidales bacterium]